MILKDQFQYALGNLHKTRLRTSLTIIGVAIGIGAMSSMVSIGVGTQRRVLQSFSEESILTSVMVRPGSGEGEEGGGRELDAEAVEEMRSLPGARDAYPVLTVPGLARTGESTHFLSLEGMPARLLHEQIESGRIKLLAGRPYREGENDLLVLSLGAARSLTPEGSPPEALVGKRISFLAARQRDGAPDEESEEGAGPALTLPSFPLSELLPQLPIGLLEPVKLEFTVGGLVEGTGTFTDFLGISLMVPLEVVEPLYARSFGNLESLLSGDIHGGGFPLVQVLLENVAQVQSAQDAIREMGFRADSILDRIAQVRRGFVLMNGFLGTVGGISLFVAAMMIVNTLVMAVLERTREIGVLKSMGATDPDVLRLFLTEAGVIGIVGGIAGLGLGWVVARITNILMNYHFESIGEVPVDLVAFPLWLILGGLGFALAVSLAAGYYPSRRAAKVDPVVALRYY